MFLARYVPVVRSFSTTLAGVARMPYPVFLFYSVSGAASWVVFFTLIGYSLATLFPDIVEFVHYIIIMVGIIIIIVSAFRHLHKKKLPEQKTP